MPVYVDTSAWIALLDPSDQYHESARKARSRIRDANETLVTGVHTLIELADGLARHASQARAADVLVDVRGSPSVRVEPSEPHLDEGLDVLKNRPDWKVDLSDCVSFALMHAHGIVRAFSYDRDFEKAGFQVVG